MLSVHDILERRIEVIQYVLRLLLCLGLESALVLQLWYLVSNFGEE